jgi:hypothetical protein
MTRLEKIVAEQLKRGDIGTAIANSTLISKLKTKFKYGITVYNFIDRHGVGKKYPPLKADEVINLIPKNKGYKNYSNGEYVFVIDDQNPISGKKETLWNVYIINKKKTFPNISDQVFDENKSGQFDQSFIITFKQYDKLLNNKNKNTNLTPSITVGDLERELVKDNPAINADFQRILNNFYIKFDLTDSTEYKNFVLANKQSDGSWDGNISSDETKKAIEYVKAGLTEPEYTGGNNINDLAKRLQSEIDAAVNESVNYFKGDNIQVSLLQLFEQALKEGFDKVKADAATKKPTDDPKTTTKTTTKTTPTTTNTKKKTSSTNFTQATFPSKYNGSGTITYNNGDKFTGSWVNGLKSGKGKYTIAATKTTIDGNWEWKKDGIITYKRWHYNQQTW